MTVIEARVRKWGNSLGIIIPSETVETDQIKEDENVKILIMKDSKRVLKATFGIGKGKIKKSGQQFKDEARRELYSS